jgi:hypothetical protein
MQIPKIPETSFEGIENFLSEVKQETLSDVVTQFVKCLERQGYSHVDFLEALADFINSSYSYEANCLMEKVIVEVKKYT